MKKITLGLVLVLVLALVLGSNAYSKNLDVKQKTDDHIIIQASSIWGFNSDIEGVKKDYYYIAQKHCDSKKKNTYFFRTDSAWIKFKLYIRFFCAENNAMEKLG